MAMRMTLALLVVPVLLAPACADGTDAKLRAALASAQASLDANPSEALFLSKDALSKSAGHDAECDAQLALVAATACLRLERRNDALDYAQRGLQLDGLPPDVLADLNWARGTALMGRFKELGEEADWRTANTALEKGTEAGHHRVEAAALLVFLQDLGRHESTERQLKFARLVLALEPDGKQAALVRKLLESKGLSP